MVDAVLVATSSVFAALVVIAAIYFLVYFQHPDDKWVAWLPKLVVVLGFALACYNIFLLPLDVANQQGQFGSTAGLPMKEISLAFFTATTVMVLVVVPFTIFYYEGEEDGDISDGATNQRVSSQIVYALKWLFPTILVSGGLVAALWWFFGTAEVPVTTLLGKLIPGSDQMTPNFCTGAGNLPSCAAFREVFTVRVSVAIYLIALTTLLGWILFSIFGGVGLVALPLDLLMDWKNGPRPMKTDDYVAMKKVIGEKAAAMMLLSEQIGADVKEANRSGSKRSRSYRKSKSQEQRFRKDVLILEYHFQRMEDAYRNHGGNLILQILGLILGCVGLGVSISWIIHICVYLVPIQIGVYPIDPFLNEFFSSVSTIPFVGVALYAVWAFWLLACVVKGTIKVGMRILFIPIHEMKIGQTMMSSLIFNVGLILLSSLAVAQFCTMSFAEYARYTASANLFAVQMVNLVGISYIYKGLVFMLLACSALSLVYLIYRPQHNEMALERLKW